MTNSPNRPTLLDAISDAMISLTEYRADIKWRELIDAAATILTHDAFLTICAYHDICPIHRCDAQICRDDSAICLAASSPAIN